MPARFDVIYSVTEAHVGCAALKHIEILRQELLEVEQHIVEKIRYK